MHEGPDNARVIAPPPVLALAAIVIGLLLDWLLPAFILTLFLPFSVRMIIGAVLAGAGAVLVIRANRAFRSAGTHPEPWKPSTELVTGDVFAWLRNPMYVGGSILLAGIAFLLASDWMLVTTIIFAVLIHFGVVRREERYLERKFGDAYRHYRDKVPRYGWPV